MNKVEPTKRNVVSLATRIYDPFRIISPVTMQFKILAQKLCEAKLRWDEGISGELLQRWETLKSSMLDMKPIAMARCYFQCMDGHSTNCNLIGFYDASFQVYAAVVYLMMKRESVHRISLVASKTRVAPLQGQTIPRLELISALLLAKLLSETMPDECIAEMKYSTPEVQVLLTAETSGIRPVMRCEAFSTLRRLIRVDPFQLLATFKQLLPQKGLTAIYCTANCTKTNW